MKPCATLVLVLLAFTVSVHAQTAAPAGIQGPATTDEAPFTDQLRKTVVFLRVTFDKDHTAYQISGTGFFVSYSDDRLPKGYSFIYLVTNRHMAEPGAEVGKKYPVQTYFARVNIKSQANGGGELESKEIPLLFSGANPWVFPGDPSVDLAATAAAADALGIDYKAIPISDFATKEVVKAQQIVAGDQVLFAGYFYQFPGDKRIQPIVRQGILAMAPDEQVNTTLHKAGTVYLADIHAFHGNSGSPIFVNTGGIRANRFGGANYLLLGAVSGYYPESETNFSLPAAKVLTGEVHDNSGITVIVPVDEIKALLDSPSLKQQRERAIQAFLDRTRTR